MRRLIALAVLVLSALPVRAETVVSAEALARSKVVAPYLASEAVTSELFVQAKLFDQQVGFKCEGEAGLRQFAPLFGAPVVMSPGDTHPQRGIWQARYVIERCGTPSLLNVLFLAQGPDTAPRAALLAPGETTTDLALQRAVYPAALDAARAALDADGATDCGRVGIWDTRMGNASDGGAPWREAWILIGCGRFVAVPLTFTPVDGGVDWAIDAARVAVMPLPGSAPGR